MNAHIPKQVAWLPTAKKNENISFGSTKLWKGYLSKHSATMYIRIRGMSGRFLVRLAGLQCIYLLPPKAFGNFVIICPQLLSHISSFF